MKRGLDQHATARVVTGVSSGIGFDLARQFAEHGYDLIIAAEDDAINTAATRLQDGAAVEPVKVDLATPPTWPGTGSRR